MIQVGKMYTFNLKNKRLQNLNCFLNIFDSDDVKNNKIIDKIYHNDICIMLEYNESKRLFTAKILNSKGKIGYIFISNKEIQTFKKYEPS